MKILVTGSEGFVGKNLMEKFKSLNSHEIFSYDKMTNENLLEKYCSECDFVYHLAGINRPEYDTEYLEGNLGFTTKLLSILKKYNNYCPILFSSSIQAKLNNPYGISKRKSEELLKSYGKEMGAEVLIYRFPNIFGKGCHPNYNSVIATFCYKIARDLPISIDNKETSLNLVYIDDVVDELAGILNKKREVDDEGFCFVKPVYSVSLGEISNLLFSYRESRESLFLPDTTVGSFSKKLYSTYLSYLPQNEFSYPLKMHTDDRGSFTELFRMTDRGQISVNISKTGIEKGNHWHNTKVEKFVVVSGKALIQLRKLGSEKIVSYHVSGEKIDVVDIPIGYTHNIINEGDSELVTIMWCNEWFDSDNPDTYFLNVNE